MVTEESQAPRALTRFYVILSGFSLLYLLSWPVLFSFDLWVFEDRGSFLNLDYLLARHLRLGVDTGYSYGLLPVFLQHVLFTIFGRGYWPMIGCDVVTLVLMAAFWALFLRRVSNQWLWTAAVVAISPLVLWVNPNFPYSLVQLSMLFALLLIVEGLPDLALAAAVIGCFSVPSLPLLLCASIAVYIALDWWKNSPRRLTGLVRGLGPGALVYIFIAAAMSLFFGFKSLLSTALPILGMKFYYGNNRGNFTDLIELLHPAGRGLKSYLVYYAGTPVTWLIASTLGIVIFAALAARRMIVRRAMDPLSAAVVLCAVVESAFLLGAYRGTDEYIIYDPLLAAGVLLGISLLASPRRRNLLLTGFLCLACLGELAQAHHTWLDWKNTRPSPLTTNLYADPALSAQWADILQLSTKRKVMMLTYGTGEHHYYPSVSSPETWFLVTSLMLPQDKERVLGDIRNADVIFADPCCGQPFTSVNQRVKDEFASMCLTEVTQGYQVWWRHPPDGTSCMNKTSTAGGRAAVNKP